MERRIGDRQLVNIVVLFLIVQFGGLLLTYASLPTYAIQPAMSISGNGASFTIYNVFIIILEIIIITFVLLYVFKKFRSNALFVLLDAFIIVPGSTITFSIVLGILLPTLPAIPELIASFALAVLLMLVKQKFQRLRNIVVLLSAMGIGVLFGIIGGFYFVYLFISVLALYDYVSVFITKHMISLANMAMQKNLALFVGSSDIHMVPNRMVSRKDRKAAAKSGLANNIKDEHVRDLIRSGNTPFVSQINLGGGDLLAPLMLATGAYVTFLNYFVPVIIVIGSTTGMLATLFILTKYKVALPAIPPIFAFENLAIAVIYLIYMPQAPITALAFFGLFAAILLVMLYTLNRNRDAGR
ncbi:MAG: hypothetical protein KGH72_03925 [Candidatus Micrarchaeota archaeon]|nr:hypothetical protein [Candidatus Micrarchaeota archaeon]